MLCDITQSGTGGHPSVKGQDESGNMERAHCGAIQLNSIIY